MASKKPTKKAATAPKKPTKAATAPKKPTKKAAATTKKPTKKAAPPPRPPRPVEVPIEVDASSPPELLFRAGLQRLPKWNETGDDLDERREAALALLRRAANAGYLEAVKMLADIDGAERLSWGTILARWGDAGPLTSMLTDDDDAEDNRRIFAAARAGEPWAMYAVGLVYGMGMQDMATGEAVATRDGAWGWVVGVPDPDAEGDRWMRLAADAGFGAAILNIATDLAGRDAHAALVEARRVPTAELAPVLRRRHARLLQRLLDDTGAPMAERLKVVTALADDGDDDALVWLGTRHRDGDGLEKDLIRARALFSRAADLGSVDGLRELGRMCEAGLGGPVDEARARSAYESAAELGNDPFARDRLAGKFGLSWYARDR